MSSCSATSSFKRSTQDSGYEYTREAIELRTSYERVRKELEKSELRDQTLTKELKAARAATHESQRELHSLKAIFAKSNAERKYLANELHEQKECNSKLEIQIARMEKPCKLIVDLDASKVENKQLLMELEKQDEIVQKSRDRDQAQRREIEALNRSIDASVHFQGGGSQPNPGSVSGDKLREIYYELGKRQADIHALSLSLSQTNTQLFDLQKCHKDLERVHSATEVEIKHVKEYNDQLLQSSITTGKDVASLETEAATLRECNSKLQIDVATLMDKLKASMLGSTETEERNEVHVSSLNSTIEELQEAKRHLTERLEALTLSLRHRESVLALTEKRLEVESQRVREDKEALAESARRGEAHSSQIDMLRSNMTNALHANEILARESREVSNGQRASLEALSGRCMRAEALNQSLAQQSAELEERLEQSAEERGEMVTAFKKSLSAAKGLSARLVQEQATSADLRQQLQRTEQSMQQIVRAKEQVSYAVLDALYKERSQGGRMAGSGSELSPHCTPGQTHVSHTHSPLGNRSDDHTPTSRPPLKHPLASSSGSVSFLPASLGGQHRLPAQHSVASRGAAWSSDGYGVVGVTEVQDETFTEDQNQAQEEDSLDGSFAEPPVQPVVNNSGVNLGSAGSDMSSKLQRLRSEVAALELRAGRRPEHEGEGSLASRDENTTGDSLLFSRDDEVAAPALPLSSDSTTSSLVSSPPAAADGSADVSSADGHLPHSLFDLVDMDPREAFQLTSLSDSP